MELVCRIVHSRPGHILRRLRRSTTRSRCYSGPSITGLKQTCLYDFHLSHGGKMVPFAGWALPLQYKDGIQASHKHVRQHVGLFDVSHMMQTKVLGRDRISFMESLVPANMKNLKRNHSTLTVFTNERGGIIDDLIVTNSDGQYLYAVSNAGCADKDLANMKFRAEEFQMKGCDVTVQVLCNALLALQGPGMVKVLQPGLDFDLSTLPFMTSTESVIFGIAECRITRCGYTGEDGVEISVSLKNAEKLANILLSSKEDEVKLAGLGARDTLRLEAGLCLYGNDMDEKTTPVEASLTWLLGKQRREAADFPGAQIILDQIKNKPTMKRVGFVSGTGRAARGGISIYDETERHLIGHVTSGCPSPSLQKNIAMGYVETAFAKIGTKVKFEIRKQMVDGEIVKMPFLPTNYYIVKN